MKTLAITAFAGILIASTGFAAPYDNGVEERFKAKFGRNTPAEEARRDTVKRAQAESVMACAGHSCCLHMRHMMAAATPAPHDAEQRFRAKFGRYTPAEESRLQIARVHPIEIMVAPPSAFEQYFKAKYGRYSPAGETRLELATAESELSASTGEVCEHDCCKRHV